MPTSSRPHRTSCYANASGGALSVTSDRKYPKNAAKTNGFGILARAWCGMYRGLSSPRIKQYKSVSCFRIVSGSILRDALRACAARPNRAALCVYRAARCGHRALRNSIGKRSVGDDAYIVPPSPAIKLSVGADASVRPPMLYRTSCKRCHCEASAHTGCGNPRPLWICAGVLRIPTTSLRTGLGMTREFLRLLSLVVAIRTPVPRPPCLKGAGTAKP